MVCPHYNAEKSRRPSLKTMIKKDGGLAIALDNCSALEIINNQYRIITSKKEACAYKLYKRGKRVIEESLPLNQDLRSLEEIKI